jgi:hypothetical protein
MIKMNTLTSQKSVKILKKAPVTNASVNSSNGQSVKFQFNVKVTASAITLQKGSQIVKAVASSDPSCSKF